MKLTDEEILNVYQTAFNAEPGCVRQAPNYLPPLVYAFARAIADLQRCENLKDAERYRLMRRRDPLNDPCLHCGYDGLELSVGEELDRYVDAAIAMEPEVLASRTAEIRATKGETK